METLSEIAEDRTFGPEAKKRGVVVRQAMAAQRAERKAEKKALEAAAKRPSIAVGGAPAPTATMRAGPPPELGGPPRTSVLVPVLEEKQEERRPYRKMREDLCAAFDGAHPGKVMDVVVWTKVHVPAVRNAGFDSRLCIKLRERGLKVNQNDPSCAFFGRLTLEQCKKVARLTIVKQLALWDQSEQDEESDEEDWE